MGVDGEVVPSEMWTRVWRRQLRLATENDFWRGLRDEAVNYAIPPSEEPSQPLPGYLVRFLRDTLHYSEKQIAATTREQAQAMLNAYYSGELREGDN
jgi:hypothetical protein